MNRQLFGKGFNSLYLILFITTSIGLMGCSTIKKPEKHKVCIDKDFEISYQGKGSAMGMMMTSSMGPMGIAVGVAIDAGKEKEIKEVLLVDGKSLSESLRVLLNERATNYRVIVDRAELCTQSIARLKILDKENIHLTLEGNSDERIVEIAVKNQRPNGDFTKQESLLEMINKLFVKYLDVVGMQ